MHTYSIVYLYVWRILKNQESQAKLIELWNSDKTPKRHNVCVCGENLLDFFFFSQTKLKSRLILLDENVNDYDWNCDILAYWS